MELKINTAASLKGKIAIPGDKSISHRAIILGAMAEGDTTIVDFLPAADCLSTLKCMRALGVGVEELSSTNLVIHGVGANGFKEPGNVLDVGNSGTTLRILTGVLAGQDFFSVLTGDESVRRRPMDRVIAPLLEMGAEIWGRKNGTRAPISILGHSLHGISYTTTIPSAQVKTALLLAGLLAEGKTIVAEEFQSRDHTERMLEVMGADISVEGTTCTISGGGILRGAEIDIPGDISSAAFLIAGALIVPDSEVLIKDVGVNPTRTGVLDVLKEMGGRLERVSFSVKNGEPRSDMLVKSSKLSGTVIGGEKIPGLIDELPVLAVVATQAQGTTVVSGAQELRVKEADRISAICGELGNLGAQIEEREDGFIVEGPTALKGTVCDSHGDHRIAMALAIAGLVATGTTVIRGAECVDISFPGFEKTLRSLIG
ncbi:MAG TPA: 3-phosphoshikimate 1-carboxyvinyltransferase [Actinobacteria bacterium]|nr:3-phosphoshikimate 1-carboxyvinyltransferase [Actinomycetota bacterium]